MRKVYSLVMCQSPGWRRMTSTSVTTVSSWSPTLGFPHIPKSVLKGQLLYKAQKTHPCLLTMWKLYPSINLIQVSLHLRKCAFLISQPCASFQARICSSSVISFEMCHSRELRRRMARTFHAPEASSSITWAPPGTA